MPDDATPDKVFGRAGAALAAGSAALTGVFGFLGVKDDALDRVLREEPTAALFFGALIALGIAFGVIVKFIDVPGSFRVIWVAIFAGILVALFPWAANHARAHVLPWGENVRLIWIADLVAVLVVIAVAGGYQLKSGGCLLVLGAVFFALGSYGAVRIAIESKNTTGVPEITSSELAAKDDGLHLVAKVEAKSLADCERLVVTAGSKRLAVAPATTDGTVTLSLDTRVTAPMTRHQGVAVEAAVSRSRCPRPKPASWSEHEWSGHDAPPWARRDWPPEEHDIGRHDHSGRRPRPGAFERAAPERTSTSATATRRARATLALPGDSAPVLTPKWDGTALIWTIDAASVRPDERAQVVVTGKATLGCVLLAVGEFPIPGKGSLSTTLPVRLPADVDEITARARLTTSTRPLDTTKACDSLGDAASRVTTRRPPSDP